MEMSIDTEKYGQYNQNSFYLIHVPYALETVKETVKT